MPIYEYQCQKCKAHIEILQKISDKPLTKCRTCGGRLEKQWSQTGFQFKGSGWYVTDYAGKKAEAKGEKESAATEAKATDKPSKPEATVATKAAEKKSASKEAAKGD